MELDYIGNINEYGDSVVRLYNFKKSQAIKFRQLIKQTILKKNKPLDLNTVPFIEARNCNLVLRISPTDEGIITTDNKTFFCDLTHNAYEKMLTLINPFCEKETKAYQYLYDVDSLIDLIFSPSGSWETEED
ncbi:MAG: hypothetical protein JXR51_02805 [Bacteroidales bacterium]|nr:hypothetical protein [Bacteroidales bacterium]MBN2756079.1 hypothetical protein [Bacteroidales bacterium]